MKRSGDVVICQASMRPQVQSPILEKKERRKKGEEGVGRERKKRRDKSKSQLCTIHTNIYLKQLLNEIHRKTAFAALLVTKHEGNNLSVPHGYYDIQ